MINKLYKILLLFIYINTSTSVSAFMTMQLYPKPPSLIKHLNYNDVLHTLEKWSIVSKKKSCEDIIWINNSNNFYPKAAIIGIYGHNEMLNYICCMQVLKEEPRLFKLINVFYNPMNDMIDDYNLILSLKSYCQNNNVLLDDNELRYINNGRYLLTMLYYSFISCS